MRESSPAPAGSRYAWLVVALLVGAMLVGCVASVGGLLMSAALSFRVRRDQVDDVVVPQGRALHRPGEDVGTQGREGGRG